MWKWIKKITLGIVCLIALLLLSGTLYQFISAKLDEKSFPSPGKTIYVGDHRLHINCTGSGKPTVILDAGMGASSLDWTLVQPEIAKFTRVCSYDRAGYSWSDETSSERTSQNIVEELHTLLKNSNETPPYILVGHSFGGINVRLYASKYPDEVAGVVLVDSSHEDQLQKCSKLPIGLFKRIATHPQAGPFLASIGFMRFLNHLPYFKNRYQAFPLAIQQMYIAKMNTIKFFRTMSRECMMFKQSLDQLKEAGGYLGDKPLVVISAGIPLSSNDMGQSQEFADNFANIWKALQKDLATKSTKGKQIIAEHSGHNISYEQPEIIVESVREMIHTL
jgi:pimeloyl-ACP methyl ester carboxylesterase